MLSSTGTLSGWKNPEMTFLWTLLFHLGTDCAELFLGLGLIYTACLKSLTFV